MWTGLTAVVLGALAGPAAADDDDLAALVERLAAPVAAERWRAERELGRALAPEDLPALLELVEAAGAEQRLRIAAALGARDEHVGLAAGLAADLRRRPREVGEWALGAALGRWRAGLQAQPLRGEPLFAALEREAAKERTQRFRIERGADLVEALDALGQATTLPVPIVVDPALRGTPTAAAGHWEALEGTWVELLTGLVAERGVGLDAAFALDEEQPDFARLVYVRLTRPELAGIDPPDAQVARWMRDAASNVGPIAARGARALGECGWPAALDWLGERWRTRADPAALAGLVVAARRGHVAPALLDPGRYRDLCRALAARLAPRPIPQPGDAAAPAGRVEDDPLAHVRPEEVAAALGRAGARLGDGTAAIDVLLGGFRAADAPWQWMAMGIAGELGVRHPLIEVVGAALLTDERAEQTVRPGALQRRALEAWGASLGADPPAPTPSRADDVLATATGREDARALLRALMRSGAPAPGGAPAAGATDLARAVRAAWQVADGRLDRGPAALVAELARLGGLGASARARRIEDLAALLRDAALDRESAVDGALAAARRDRTVASAATELAARVGRLEPAAHGPLLAGALAERGAGGLDAGLLVALATGPVGARAQELLLERLAAEVADPALHDPETARALGAVVRALLAAERDGEALGLRARVRRAVRADGDAPAARLVLDRAWPGSPGLEPEPLRPPSPSPYPLTGARTAEQPGDR